MSHFEGWQIYLNFSPFKSILKLRISVILTCCFYLLPHWKHKCTNDFQPWNHKIFCKSRKTNLEEHVTWGQRLNWVSCRGVGGRGWGWEAQTFLQRSTFLPSSVSPMCLLVVLLQKTSLQSGRTQDGIRFIEHVVRGAGLVCAVPGSLQGKGDGETRDDDYAH